MEMLKEEREFLTPAELGDALYMKIMHFNEIYTTNLLMKEFGPIFRGMWWF